MQIGVLEGDGIGPEIVPMSRRCVEATNADVAFLELPVGYEGYEKHGSSVPESSVTRLAECDGWILGPTMAGEYPEADEAPMNPSGLLRKRYDLYANVRPVRSYEGIGPPGMDVTIFRQNTEGFYSDRNMFRGQGQFMPTEDVALSTRVVTRMECRRIAEAAFEFASCNDMDVTAVHKANVLDQGDGMFLEACQSVGAEYSDVDLKSTLVDAFAMELVCDPTAHGVVVTTNLYGDILSDEAAGVVGSLGLAPSINYGDEHAMAQAAHGAAPDIAGEGVANPVAMILSTAMLLDWFGNQGHADADTAATRIRNAVQRTLKDIRTPDIGGCASTEAFTDAVVDAIKE
jgi:3-isopropylmalate dehydrogenase